MKKDIDMNNTTQMVRVDFEEYSNGYIATSKYIEGLFVSHTSYDKVLSAVPAAIRLLMKAQYGVDFVVEEYTGDLQETRPVSGVKTFYAKAA